MSSLIPVTVRPNHIKFVDASDVLLHDFIENLGITSIDEINETLKSYNINYSYNVNTARALKFSKDFGGILLKNEEVFFGKNGELALNKRIQLEPNSIDSVNLYLEVLQQIDRKETYGGGYLHQGLKILEKLLRVRSNSVPSYSAQNGSLDVSIGKRLTPYTHEVICPQIPCIKLLGIETTLGLKKRKFDNYSIPLLFDLDNGNHRRALEKMNQLDSALNDLLTNYSHKKSLYKEDIYFIEIGKKLKDFKGKWINEHGNIIKRMTESQIPEGTILNVSLQIQHLWMKGSQSKVKFHASEIQIVDRC